MFGNVEKRKKALLFELQGIDINLKERSLLDEEKASNDEIASELERTSLLEEVSWRQKTEIMDPLVERGRQEY